LGSVGQTWRETVSSNFAFCEAVEGIAVLATAGGKFAVHVVDYGSAKKHLSDRAVRCIQHEQQRRYHLKPD
jgi:hypothetical protein